MREWTAWQLHLAAPTPEMHVRALREVVAPAVEGCQHWFFLRYWQGGPHLRVRIGDLDARSAGQIDAEMRKRLAAVNQLAAGETTLDAATYEAYAAGMGQAGEEGTTIEPGRLRAPGLYRAVYVPEFNRYGGEALIPLSERLFVTSSRLVLAFLQREPTSHAQTGFALRSLATALDVIGDPAARIACCRAAANSWLSWLHRAGRSQAELDALVNTAGERAARLVATAPHLAEPITTGPVAAWGRELAEAWPYWQSVSEHDTRAQPRSERILFSHLHMFCNRLGMSVAEEFFLHIVLAELLEAAETERSR
ncbi:hypothetical protein GCM10012275_35030 [Longimycelium tulufanense]|uniref:Thiopeptide-type bacteriocin biosynthesis domain-containing protein n=1 Tax=Longimycelium tulufanense TaxID=907463 RepID=A0A8J3FVU9_9PSEU|nr:thiopeptide-type bacteriocin biosynthesis protein [Longimycelium tulufanense]GGM60971.1 hypothetical protein GCM10012275_35030 [Longimycelium tulufanense]